MLEEKLVALKGRLIEYASLVEKMIDLSIEGLLKKEPSHLEEVMKTYEPKANDMEIVIDEDCISLIAQFQPKAGDLRTIHTIMRMNNDLERMGDHAVNICESALFLLERPAVKPLIDIPRMAELSASMLKDSIASFIESDSKMARHVCERDERVDELGEQVLRELITYMSSDITTIERSLHLLRIARNLERIADLSTNICEDTIFMVDGRVIKHHKDA
jgi:phosphate transport system protein